MTTIPLRCSGAVFLHRLDGLLAEEDKELPFARHVVSARQHFYFVEYFIVVMFMEPEEVIISNPKRQAIVGAVDVKIKVFIKFEQ